MKESLHDIDLIERYFDNELSPPEASELENRLKNDGEFEKLFNREKLLINAIRLEAAARDIAYLKTLESKLERGKTFNMRTQWYMYAAAACIALIAFAVWFTFRTPTPESLFTAYFDPHPNIFEVTLRDQSAANARSQAFQAYDQEDYARASMLFTDLLKDNKDPGMLMLLGNANLVLGKTELAKENFSAVIAQYDDLDTAAKWYLALACLQGKETGRASLLLKEIERSQSHYGAMARNLLDDME